MKFVLPLYRKWSDKFDVLSTQKEALEQDINSLRKDNDRLRVSNEALVAEKWEITNANNELKARLQQSMAMSMMQVSKFYFSSLNVFS